VRFGARMIQPGKQNANKQGVRNFSGFGGNYLVLRKNNQDKMPHLHIICLVFDFEAESTGALAQQLFSYNFALCFG
jgi:hypothetical protein